MKIQWYNSWSV